MPAAALADATLGQQLPNSRDQIDGDFHLAGVPEASITVMGVCTGDDRERCWSYRRDGAAAGRMVAAIRI